MYYAFLRGALQRMYQINLVVSFLSGYTNHSTTYRAMRMALQPTESQNFMLYFTVTIFSDQVSHSKTIEPHLYEMRRNITR